MAVRDGPAQEWGIRFSESENAFTIQRGILRPATVWTAEGDQVSFARLIDMSHAVHAIFLD